MSVLFIFHKLFLDVDECDIGTYVCAQMATCDNTPGSYGCTCIDGYEGNGVTCTGMLI